VEDVSFAEAFIFAQGHGKNVFLAMFLMSKLNAQNVEKPERRR